jgi:hypothetical protein
MEGLAGDLGTMPFPDLVHYLGDKALTGTLVCERGTVKKSLAVKDGAVVNAASNDPREYLGQFLINFGHLTEDQLTRAFQAQAESKAILGRILINAGMVSEETVKQVLTIKVRETALGMCRWKEGIFRFARGVLPTEKDAVQIAVPLLDLHREAEFRETVWSSMVQIFPSGNLCLKVDESKLPKDLQANSVPAQLFDLMREGHTIEEICLRLHATDFHLYQRLYALYRQGVITPVEPQPRAAAPDGEAVGEEMGAADILKITRDFLSAKNFADAEALAARAVELKPSPEAVALLKEAETGLLEELRREFLTGTRVPRFASPDVKLKSLDLTPQEKYLLSRIDGAREIKAIIRVSPVRELDALKCFRHFIEVGYIVVG